MKENSETGKIALIVAIETKIESKFAIESLKALLQCDNIDVNIQDNKGCTALIRAAVEKNIEGTKSMLFELQSENFNEKR